MATDGQVIFIQKLSGIEGDALASFAALTSSQASSAIGALQAARGRAGALRIRPVKGPRRYGKNEKQRGRK